MSSQPQWPPLLPLLELELLELLLLLLLLLEPLLLSLLPPPEHEARWLHLGVVGAPSGQGTRRQRMAMAPRLSSASLRNAV